MKRAFLLVVWAWPVLAFLPAVDVRDGVEVSIAYPSNVVEKAFDFTVSVSNGSARSVSGPLNVFLNNDWKVFAGHTAKYTNQWELSLAVGGTTQIVCQAWRRSDAVSGHYPVHAEFGGAHAIGVFTTAFDRPVVEGFSLERPVRRFVESGAGFHLSGAQFNVHPAWKGGVIAPAWAEWDLPVEADEQVLRVVFRGPSSEKSDGVSFVVSANERVLKQVDCAPSAVAPVEVSLAEFAGKPVKLRIACGPGAKNNTAFDSASMSVPVLVTKPSKVEGTSGQQVGAFRTGMYGLMDGVLGFDGLAVSNFIVEVDHRAVYPFKVEVAGDSVTHFIRLNGQVVPLRAQVSGGKDFARVQWSMPEVVRDERGSPRFTKLALGEASQKAKRFYAGFGNVVEDPEDFRLGNDGFHLATRFIGADYPSGVSLLQASDIYPDCAENSGNRLSLVVSHDATLTFVFKQKGGAFAAARQYRDMCGYEPGEGVANLMGRMCIDQWWGDYTKAAADLERVASYGVTNAVFVKHVWQRWGYDYRLPEIYPPEFGLETFLPVSRAAQKHGILFCPHDNYIDFYPDAKGFGYDHIVFHSDGTPYKAWLNKRHGGAQSYRWLPHAFKPWLMENMEMMRDGMAPDALFIDVFNAIAPFDYYDRKGRFYPKMETERCWADAFITSRKILKPGAPMISEAGTVALVGAVDGVQCDHFPPTRWDIGKFGDSERVPWHDMVTHNKMVLFAGGLGHRYGAASWDYGTRVSLKHHYGSDDYLSNTIIGGRNPMCDGPFSRRTVATYWLLNDICDELGRAKLEEHAFGPTIHQQQTAFSNGGKVYSNRGTNTWTVADGKVLPEYGFYGRTPESEAGVMLFNGVRGAFAHHGNVSFYDARPPYAMNGLFAESDVEGVKYLGDGKFATTFRFSLNQPLPQDYQPFIHYCRGEDIVQQSVLKDAEEYLKPGGKFGKFTAKTTVRLAPGEYELRYGFFNLKTGERMFIVGNIDHQNRIYGGKLVLTSEGVGGHIPAEPEEQLWNPFGTQVNFGGVKTDGAFRLIKDRTVWKLIPLPGSLPFRVELQVSAGVNVTDVSGCTWSQKGNTLSIVSDGKAFEHVVSFGRLRE